MLCKGSVSNFILNELELIYLHPTIAIVSTQLNCFNYCNLTLKILFDINHLLAHREEVTSIQIKQIILFNITHLFVQLNGIKYCYVSLTVQLKISHLFTHS